MMRIIWIAMMALISITSYADDTVVARVNGVSIISSELDAAVDQLIPRSTYHGNVTDEKRHEFREKALNNLIDAELQYQDAVVRGMEPDKKQAKTQMQLIRDRFQSKKEYKIAIEQAGLTEDRLRARIEKELMTQAAITKSVTEPSRMSDEALKDHYEKNIANFRQPESARLRVFSSKDEAKAKDALAKLKGGEDFGNIAARMSEDSFRIKGGDIGYIHRGRVLPEIEDAAFKLKVGEMSDLIKADNTWFIIKLEEKKPAHQMTFEEAKDKLKKELEEKRSNELKETWMADLRAKAKIEIVGAVGSRQ